VLGNSTNNVGEFLELPEKNKRSQPVERTSFSSLVPRGKLQETKQEHNFLWATIDEQEIKPATKQLLSAPEGVEQ